MSPRDRSSESAPPTERAVLTVTSLVNVFSAKELGNRATAIVPVARSLATQRTPPPRAQALDDEIAVHPFHGKSELALQETSTSLWNKTTTKLPHRLKNRDKNQQ